MVGFGRLSARVRGVFSRPVLASVFGRRAANLWIGTFLVAVTLLAGGAFSSAQAATFPCSVGPTDISGLRFTNAGNDSFQLSGVLTGAAISATTGACGGLASTTIRPIVNGTPTAATGVEIPNATAQGGSLIRVSATEVNYKPPSANFSGADSFTIDNNNVNRVITVNIIVDAPPSVTNIIPNTGPTAGGQSVTLTGSNLANASQVSFGATTVSSSSFIQSSATAITVVAPPHAPGAVDVTVTTPGGTSATSASARYIYVAPPTVTSVAPNAGRTTGGNTVVLTGTNFTVNSSVRFGGAFANSVTVNSATQITATAPSGSAGTVNITVQATGGTSATGPANAYVYASPPTLTAAFSPTTIISGGTSTVSLTLANPNGAILSGVAIASGALPTNLSYVPGSSATSCTSGTVTISGNAISLSGATLAANASCAVTFQVTSATAGDYNYTSGAPSASQTATGAAATTPTALTVGAPAPMVTSISPTTGPAAGGTSVTLTGTDFTGATAVSFGGTPATGFTVTAADSITATAPAGTGAVDVTVTTSGGTSATSPADQFTYVAAAPAPRVLRLSQNQGSATTPARIGVLGSNFSTSGNTVTFGGVAGTITAESATSITVVPPASSTPSLVDVVVTTADGQSSTLANAFRYVVPPTLTLTFTPATLNGAETSHFEATLSNPNAASTLAGVGFSVSFSNFPAGWVLVDGASLGCAGNTRSISSAGISLTGARLSANATCTISGNYGGATSSGVYTVTSTPTASGTTTMTMDVGGVATTSNALTINAPPSISAVSPATGPVAGGTVVTLSGANFTGATAVTFGAAAATGFTVNSAGQITATAPAGTGTVDVTVTATGGTSATSAADQFAYLAAPTANAQSVVTAYQTPRAITLTGVDSNTPARTLTYSVTTAPAHGTLSGTAPNLTFTPVAGYSGTDSFSFTTNNGAATSSPATVSITVQPPAPTVTTNPADRTVAVGASVSFTAAASGSPTVQWQVSGDGGASYADIAGATATTYTFTAAAGDNGNRYRAVFTNSGGVTNSNAAALTAVSPPSATAQTVAVAYQTARSITLGGTDPQGRSLIYSVASAPSHGTLSGTAPNLTFTPAAGYSGADSFTFTANNGVSTSAAATVSITVAGPPLTIATGAASDLRVGANYSQANTASGGLAPYSYTLNAGAFPPGTTLNASTGLVSGVPTVAGSFSYIVQVSDSQGPAQTAVTPVVTSTIAKGDQTITFTSTAPSNASVGGSPYTVTATAGSGLTVARTVDAGAAGVCSISGGSVSFQSPGTCVINADQAGDANWNAAPQAQQSFAVVAPTITPSPATLANGTTGVVYSQTITATGGSAPYGYAVTAGALPAGISLSNAGVLSGTPTAGGSFSFTVTATDANGSSGARSYTVTVAAPTVTIAPATLPVATTRIAYSQAVTASGGVAPYSYAVTAGALPAGITLAPNGVLSGTTNAAGGFTFSVTATDSATGSGPYSSTRSYTLTVSAPSIVIAPATLPAGVTRVAYSQTLTATGGTAPHSYAVTAGALPAGITLSSAGVLSGTTTTAGAYTFSVTTTDANGNAGTRGYTLSIGAPAVTLAPNTLAAGTAGTAYSQTVTASGGTGPYSYAVTAGALPAGVTLSSAGALSGTPTTDGSFGFTVTATDADGNTGASGYTLTIAAPTVTITPTTLPAGAYDVAYSQTITASGGVAPYGYAMTGGALPAGISLSPTGVLSGSTTVIGSFAFTVTATDSAGGSGPFTASQAYALVIAAPSAPTAAPASADVGYNATGQAIGLSVSGVYTTLSVATAPAHGSVTIAGTTATYVPATDYFGSDSFTYTATGPGGTSAPATVSLTVAAPPPPVVTPPPPVTTPVPAAGSGDATGSVSVDLPTTTTGEVTGYRITATPQHGSAQIEVVSGGGALSGMLQAGAMPIYRLKYTPAANFLGTDTVSVVADGPGGTSAPAVFTFQVPGKAPDLTAQTVSNASVTISPTTGLSGGPFQALRITRQPAFGTATVSGLTIVFTPGARNGGATSLDYVIDLPFGSSAAGRIDLTSNAAPSAQVLTARTPAGRPVTVRITDGAIGGPFTGAAITGITPAGSATAVLVKGGTTAAPTWDLTVTPQGTFTGDTVIGFTLTNAFAATAGTLTVTVDPRPDPSLDPDVRGVVSSQVESARRFAGAQTDNFNRRLEQIRQGGGGGGASNMLSVNAGFAADGSLLDPNARARQQLGATRQPLGDEGLRARLGLQDDADRDRLGGRDRASQPFVASDDTALDDRRNAAPGARGADGQPSMIGVWAAGGVDWGRRDAETGARDYRFTTSGVSAGSDLKLSDSLVVGVGAGYGFDRTKVGSAGSQSEGRSVVVAAYGGWKATPSLSVDGVLGYGDLNYDSRRWATAASAGAGGYAFGDRKGDMVFGSLSLVWDQVQGRANRSVYGRVEAQSVSLNAFTETGADIYALTYDRLAFDSLSSTLGLRYDWRIARRNGAFTPAVRLEWSHAFDHAGPQTVAYADWLTSPRYGVGLDGWDRDTIEVGIDGGWKVGDSLDLSAGYRAALGANTATQGLQFKLMTRF